MEIYCFYYAEWSKENTNNILHINHPFRHHLMFDRSSSNLVKMIDYGSNEKAISITMFKMKGIEKVSWAELKYYCVVKNLIKILDDIKDIPTSKVILSIDPKLLVDVTINQNKCRSTKYSYT